MDIKKSYVTAKQYLLNAQIPQETKTYKPVLHQQLIDLTLESIQSAGFELETETYSGARDGAVANGKYTISSTKDATVYDFQIEISSLTISSPAVSDAQSFNQKVLQQSFNSRDYYRMDVNNDNNFTVTDVYLVYAKIIGRGWKSGIPVYRIFTPTEWNTISTSSTNLKSTYSGTQTITLSGVSNKGSSNYYLIRTGFRN